MRYRWLFCESLYLLVTNEGGRGSLLAGSLRLPLPSPLQGPELPTSALEAPERLPGMSHKQGPHRKGELWVLNLDHSG